MNKTDRNGRKEKERNFESIKYSRKLALKLCMHLKLELNSFFHISFCNFINICSWMQFDWNVNPFECIRNSNTKLNDPNGDSVWNNKKRSYSKVQHGFRIKNSHTYFFLSFDCKKIFLVEVQISIFSSKSIILYWKNIYVSWTSCCLIEFMDHVYRIVVTYKFDGQQINHLV